LQFVEASNTEGVHMLEQPVHVKMLIAGKWTGGPNIIVAVFSAAGHWIFNQVINMIECNLIDWFLDLERPRRCILFHRHD
jgi:hypothetical protein